MIQEWYNALSHNLHSPFTQIDLNFISDAGNMWRPVIALKYGKAAEQMLSFKSG